jgi:site-specific DNA-methyltransferase (adenine-specific)
MERLGPYVLGAVHQVDCVEAMRQLPDGSISCIITDPPYSEAVHKNVTDRPTDGATDPRPEAAMRRCTNLGFVHLGAELRRAVCVEFARLVQRWVLVFCDAEGLSGWITDLEAVGLRHVRVGAWVKQDAAPSFHGRYPASWMECIEIAHTQDAMRWNGHGRGALWTRPIVLRGRVHSAQKPVELMQDLVRDFTEPGEVILDPFAGSGTTGIACKRMGRLFLGFERDPQFAGAASFRVQTEVERLGEVQPETAQVGQQIGLLGDEK